MSITPMKKVTIAGSALDKKEVLENLQNLGVVHIVPLVEHGKKPTLSCDDVNEAIRYLTDASEVSKEQRHDKNFNVEVFARSALDNKQERIDLQNTHKRLFQYIEMIKDWGDFKIPSPEAIGGNKLHFYKMDKKALKRLQDHEDYVWQVIHQSDDGVDYVVVIADKDQEVSVAGATNIEFCKLTLSEAEAELIKTDKDLEENEKKRIALTLYLEALERHKDKLLDEIDYNFVNQYSLDKDGMFIVHGWTRVKDLKDLETFSKTNELALIQEEPTEDDEPPTLLHNNILGAPGEELVKFYQMPAYKMWDPSTVMHLSFALFFAMIMSDFGYGIMMSAITLLTWKKMAGSEVARRIRTMLVMLSGSCLVYGVICGSYFGYEAPIAAFRDLHLVDVNNFDSMIKLSVGIGALHIILANIVRFFNALPKLSALSFIGWIATVIGAFSLYAVGQDTLWAQHSLIGGFATILLFSSDRPFFSIKGLIMRPIDGLLNLTNLTKAFGDCLSYIRLFALGLSSALLAASFNSMAEQAMSANTILGTGLGILVLCFGHTLNLVLGIIGGLVHGLRLNFIEFSNWALSGEGYQFKPFESKENKKWKN